MTTPTYRVGPLGRWIGGWAMIVDGLVIVLTLGVARTSLNYRLCLWRLARDRRRGG